MYKEAGIWYIADSKLYLLFQYVDEFHFSFFKSRKKSDRLIMNQCVRSEKLKEKENRNWILPW